MAGPLSALGWDYVFYALMISSFLGLVVRMMKNSLVAWKAFLTWFYAQLLTRLMIREITRMCPREREARQESTEAEETLSRL